LNQEHFDKLVAPIPGEHPCGEDISYLPIFDEIREARREDDSSLGLGEWETELKSAQWPKVRGLCEEILQARSKDLQIACWYVEAMTHLSGFAGVEFGFRVLDVLLTDFWEFCFPALDPDDLDERNGRIGWLNKQMPIAIRGIRLTAGNPGYCWLDWEESRAVENLGLKDAEAKDKAIAAGKLSADAFDSAVSVSGLPFYEKLHRQIKAAANIVATVERNVDARFGSESHGLKDVRSAIADVEEVVRRIIMRLGGNSDTSPVAEHANDGNKAPASEHLPGRAAPVPVAFSSHIQSRPEAIAALRQVASFFRQSEPHSPVGLLAERAARWAEMPLERWLESVIKDDSTLNQLKELLDVPREH
jgi:type VI secretion system protein ImpA